MPSADANLPTPDFTYDPETDLIAGIRPFRKDTFRLESAQLGDKLVIHNYGHGGGGISMALGCAHVVRDMLVTCGRASAGTPVAVLGGGVIGLTAAKLLREMDLRVTMYAASYSDTTSYRAGGQWAPSLVAFEPTAVGKARFEDILRRAFRGYESMIGQGYGVSRRLNYTWVETASFKKVPHDLIPPPTYLPRLPFEGHAHDGFVYQTLLIEPPKLLDRLRKDLRDAAVDMQHRDFASPRQVAGLPQTIVINCLGLGSRRIWPDDKLTPIKGQLIRLKPQSTLQYLYSGSPNGYIFPREDKVIVGGTEEYCNEDDTPHEDMCAEIIQAHSRAFSGHRALAADVPDWFAKFK